MALLELFYRANKNAWMTTGLFDEYLRHFNAHLASACFSFHRHWSAFSFPFPFFFC